MLKMSVSPLAIRNSNMPNSTPFKVEIRISSSTKLLRGASQVCSPAVAGGLGRG
jgi:hypothetical protein